MAISPLAIATQGVLNSPLSVAAVRGRLNIPLDVSVPGSGSKKGPSFVKGEWEHPYVRLEKQRIREDEEIMIVISAFIKVMNR